MLTGYRDDAEPPRCSWRHTAKELMTLQTEMFAIETDQKEEQNARKKKRYDSFDSEARSNRLFHLFSECACVCCLFCASMHQQVPYVTQQDFNNSSDLEMSVSARARALLSNLHDTKT